MLPFQGCRIPICDTEAHADQWWKSLTCCNAHRLHWDDPRRSEMWIRVWAGRIQRLGRDIPTLSQKETCSSWDKKKKEHANLPISCHNAAARTTVGVPGSGMDGRLQCPQSIYLRAHQSPSVLGDALQHDLLSQYDGALRPGYCS